jgi:xanthine dehydrogenase accessory factor
MFERIAELRRKGQPVTLATVIQSKGSVPRHEGSKMLVFTGGRIEGTIGGGDMEARVIKEALKALENGRCCVLSYAFRDIEKGDVGVCGGEVQIFLEPISPPPKVIVVGGGHVGRAVAHLAHWLGFRVVLSDDRPHFATADAVPDADEHVPGPLSELPSRVELDQNSYVLLTTRGVPVDLEGLPALLNTSAAYIGVIGSRRRWEVCAQELRRRGVSDEKIARVTSPMGLDLDAESPEEIALSILAEIIMLRRNGSGKRLNHSPQLEVERADTVK